MNPHALNIVHTEASCGWGGQEVRILTESQGLIRRGHAVQILCNAESAIRAKAEELGIPVTTLPLLRVVTRQVPAASRSRISGALSAASPINGRHPRGGGSVS